MGEESPKLWMTVCPGTEAAERDLVQRISVTMLSLWSDNVVIGVVSHLSLYPVEMMNHSCKIALNREAHVL